MLYLLFITGLCHLDIIQKWNFLIISVSERNVGILSILLTSMRIFSQDAYFRMEKQTLELSGS